MSDQAYDGRALLEADLSTSERAVLDVIKVANPCYAYWDDVASMAGLSESTVRRAASALVDRGLAERWQEKRTNRVGYALTLTGTPFDRPGFPPGGFVAGRCGHAVAKSEWRAGFRNCERCGV